MEQATTTSRRAPVVALATAADLEGAQQDSGTPEDTGFELVRLDHEVSRLAARRALAAIGLDPSRLEVLRRPGAAPAVVANGSAGEDRELALSLTHRDGRGAAMVAEAPARIGIDLEREEAVTPQHARYFLTAQEQAALRSRSVATLWALKEAAWKALELGDDFSFLGLELHLDLQGRVKAVSVQGTRVPAKSCVWSPWPGYVLATIELEGGQ